MNEGLGTVLIVLRKIIRVTEIDSDVYKLKQKRDIDNYFCCNLFKLFLWLGVALFHSKL